MIESKISTGKYLWTLLMIFLIVFGFIMYIVRSIIWIIEGKADASYWFVLIFVFLDLLLLYIIKDFKHMNICEETNQVKYRSLFHPFGKTLYFKDFIGIYKTTETGSEGTYNVVYLVDKNNITRFKIMGLYYKNMDEIIAAIPLPEIKKNLSAGQYFKLMFTGRANLSKIKPKNKSKKTTETTENKIGKYMRIFIAVAFLIFVITMIIRIISKL
jgi:hypothetical protein